MNDSIIKLIKLLFQKNYCLFFNHKGISSYVLTLDESMHMLKTLSCHSVTICDVSDSFEKIGFIEFETNIEGEFPKGLLIGDYNKDGHESKKVSGLIYQLNFFDNIDFFDEP